ncbi:bifunctional diguanylate cyclase/phosphodiesterase [Aestuariibacter sp. GS-14]|uniref:putative bifunctional diguanylate cyclase/phosphodiesterase n=1 Tax=Aestuariibacter sp. GS-14 TaxID=2590670 RepID=UPI0021073B58|nr:EAL domain-containing protein [Aestuariibacter sp. GS-14]
MEKSLNIVVIDDDLGSLAILESGLADLANIETAGSGSEGLALVAVRQPDIVLLDIELPDVSGFEVCRRIKTHAFIRTPAIIFITSHQDYDTERKALEAGGIDFITKPFDLTLCRARVSNHLQLKKQEQAVLAARHQVEEERQYLNVVLNSIADGVIATDPDGRITFINPVAQRLTGWHKTSSIGHHIKEVMVLSDASNNQVLPNPVEIALKEKRTVAMALNAKLTSRLGGEYRVEDSAALIRDKHQNLLGCVIVFQDVTESIALATQMTHLANHDQLTGLPNRMLLHDRVLQSISRVQITRRSVALLLIDIDNFKYLNDAKGHSVGDLIITEVAQRLEHLCDSKTTLARVGGDEFVVMLPEVHSPNLTDITALNIIDAMQEPFSVAGDEHTLSVSIGVSIYPSDSSSAEELMRHADTAMYRAKTTGKNRYCYFSTNLQLELNERVRIEKLLRSALEEHKLVVLYQPKYNLASGEITGAEALVRLAADDGSLILPNRFIEFAEESGLIHELGRQVLQQSINLAKRFYQHGKILKIAVNIAAQQFHESDICEQIETMLNDADLSCNLIELEVTESALMMDFAETRGILNRLSALGISIALDDFGTGYSSLNYLRSFPLDVLKIDRSFVNDMFKDQQAKDIVDVIVRLARTLNLKLVGEGIETKEQRQVLQQLGCDEGQGYYFSKPINENDFFSLLANLPQMV